MFLREILTAYHTQHIKLAVLMLCHKLFCHFLDIMVIGTCHTLITGNYDTADLTVFLRNLMTDTEKRMLCIRHMTQDSGNCCLHIIVIRLCIRQDSFGLLHLG